jgi:hypothetical protein
LGFGFLVHFLRLWVQGSGGFQGLGPRVKGKELRIQGLWLMFLVQGGRVIAEYLGIFIVRVQGLGFRV